MLEANKNLFDGEIDFHGMTLRPLTIGTMEVCRDRGLTLFSGETVSPQEQIRQTAAYLWIQSEPLESVLASIREGLAPEDWFKKYILPFMFRISPKALESASVLIMDNVERVGLSVVEVVAKPGHDEETDPPN